MKPTLYQSWFCPFAQRAWIALLAKEIDFELKEQDPYDKNPEWLAVNPRGLVPTIVNNNKCIYESGVCIEYVDEAFVGPNLLSRDPFERAKIRMISDQINKKIAAPFYHILMKDDDTLRNASIEELIRDLQDITSQMDTNGPYIMGNKVGMADIMLFPHCWRFFILEHYRGFSLPAIGLERFHAWMEAMLTLKCVQDTLPDKERLLQKYKRYFDGTANTLVATAVRTGTAMP